jgi:hypothetical protein
MWHSPRRDCDHQAVERIEAGRPVWVAAARALLLDRFREEESRLLLERRHLDGYRALFPDMAACVVGFVEVVALEPPEAIDRNCRGVGGPSPALEELREQAQHEAAAWADRLAAHARSKALDLMQSDAAWSYLEADRRGLGAGLGAGD